MPKFTKLEIDVNSTEIVFDPAQNGATSVWIGSGANLESNSSVTYTRRPTTKGQTTRKSAFGLTVPFASTCETTCSVVSRGVALYKLDNVVDVRLTTAERELAFDQFVALLQQADVRDAIINNGSFYS